MKHIPTQFALLSMILKSCISLPFKLSKSFQHFLVVIHRELLQHPEVPVPPVMELLSNSPTGELSPEIKLLIDEELSEDSSDEEYNPENEPEPPVSNFVREL